MAVALTLERDPLLLEGGGRGLWGGCCACSERTGVRTPSTVSAGPECATLSGTGARLPPW